MQYLKEDYLMQIVFVFVIGVGVTLLFTPVSIKLAHRFGIMDIPKDDRRMHVRAMPRFGGLGIFVGSTAALIMPASQNTQIMYAMIGGLLMYILGTIDDIFDLKPLVKFAGQTAIAIMMYAVGIRITFISDFFGSATANENANLVLSNSLAFIITVLWIVGVTNAVNLMDGLDGLAAGTTAIMMMSLAYIAYIHGDRYGRMTVCVALVAIAASCIGFLPYNFSPAKTFMGDGGALYLGYMIAVLSVISPLKKATLVASIIPIMTLAIPIFDTLFAIVRRSLNHEPIMKADHGHLHHHLMAAGFGQRRSVLIIYGIVGIMGMVAVLLSRELYKDAFFLATIAALYLSIILVRKQPKKKSYAKLRKMARRRKQKRLKRNANVNGSQRKDTDYKEETAEQES